MKPRTQPFRAGLTYAAPPALVRWVLGGGGEAAHEVLLASEKVFERLAGGGGFNAALDFGEFALELFTGEGVEAALGFFPSELLSFFEEDFEEEAALAVFEDSTDFGGVEGIAGKAGDDEGGKDFFGFEA